MGGTRAYIKEGIIFCPDHAAAGHAQHPHIQGVDIGAMPSNNGVFHSWSSILDHADVGGSAANLKVDAGGSPQVHQSSHHTGCRTTEHGEHRSLFHFIGIHDATIATHDHQWHGNSGMPHSTLSALSSVKHLR